MLYSLCLHGRAELGLAPDEYAALTMVLLRLMAFKPAGAAQGGSKEKKTLKTGSDEAVKVSAQPRPGTDPARHSVPAPQPRCPV